MDNYNLKAEEVVLYKGNGLFKNKKGITELILTNINIVFINKYKKPFSKEEITVYEYSVRSIKIYEGVPQIRTKGNIVEIYLLENEVEFEFYAKTELHKFVNASNKLLTGETSVQKGAKKIKNAIGLVNDTLGINTVEATGNLIKNGIVGNVTGALGKIGSLFNKKKK